MFLIMNPLTFFLLCSSVFSFCFYGSFRFFFTSVYVASHVRTRLARSLHVLYTLLHVLDTFFTRCCTFYIRTPRLVPYLWILSSSLLHFVSLDFLKFFSNFSTVVCCTSLTPCPTLRHVVTPLLFDSPARPWHPVSRLTHVRHVKYYLFHVLHTSSTYRTTFAHYVCLFLTLSHFLPCKSFQTFPLFVSLPR